MLMITQWHQILRYMQKYMMNQVEKLFRSWIMCNGIIFMRSLDAAKKKNKLILEAESNLN